MLPTVDSQRSIPGNMLDFSKVTSKLPTRADHDYTSNYQSQTNIQSTNRSRSQGLIPTRKVPKKAAKSQPKFDESKYPDWLFKKKSDPMVQILKETDEEEKALLEKFNSLIPIDFKSLFRCRLKTLTS